MTATSDLPLDAAPTGGLLARHRIAIARFGTDVAAAGGIGPALAAGLDPADYPVLPAGVPQAWERTKIYLGLCERYQELYQAQVAELRLLMASVPGCSLPLSHRRPRGRTGPGARDRPGAGQDGHMEVQGFADGRFGPVRQCFAEILAAQPGTGAAFAAWCDGRLVVDLWGGYADLGRRRLWEADSLVQPYSVSKPFAAVCALRLVEAGRLDLDAPVQRYWPGFRAPATVRHVLSHQAGVVVLDRHVPTEAFYDWDWLCALLAAQQPAWPPGTAHGESPLFYGHLVGELVRRVDGRGVGRFLAEEICGPAGLDFAFGLSPSQQARAVDLTGLDDAFRAGNAVGRPALYRLAVTNPPGAQDGTVVNSAAWRAAEIPAVNGHGTARAVAGFYHALAAGSLLSPGMLAEAVTPQCAGPDRVFGDDNAWGLGFGISDDGYGMGGLGGNYGGASAAGGYTIGFATGSVGSHDRIDTLENTLRECLGLAPIPATGDPPPGS